MTRFVEKGQLLVVENSSKAGTHWQLGGKSVSRGDVFLVICQDHKNDGEGVTIILFGSETQSVWTLWLETNTSVVSDLSQV